MDYLPFDTVGLNVDGIDIFYNSCKLLKEHFDIQPTGHIDFHLEDFELFRNHDVNVRGSFAIKQGNNDCYILFTEVVYSTPTAHRGGDAHYSNFQIWALAYVKHNFGRVLIRRETLADKIIEIVHPVEIDFENDKAFSDTFYVVANDFDKAVLGINRSFRNAVMDVRHDDFNIEVFDHTLIIGDRKHVTPEKAVHLAEFVSRLCATC